jgi:transposase-like protein
MKKAKENAARSCPHCGKHENQVNAGRNRSGTQRCFCKECRKYYTFEPKRNAYDEETRANALKIYYSGVSGRGMGKVLGMSKANVYNWIKKNGSNPCG